MKLTFYGAAKEVTGSCHMLSVNGANILIDCGMQQGHDNKNNDMFAFDAEGVNHVIVTHAHIDHTGRLPLLVKKGYSGKIHATGKTSELMSIMLLDSAHIQESDAAWENRKGKRSAKNLVEPLYTAVDAENTIKLVEPHPYGETIDLCDGVKFRFADAGHLLGSASVEMWLEEDGVSRKIVFSGDIGNKNQPIIRDPQYITEADYALTESTYGDRLHEQAKDYTYDLARILDDTFAAGGNVVVPAFAVGRAQELLYFIREIKERKIVKSKPGFAVYVDSPLAVEATHIYDTNLNGYVDQEMIGLIKGGYNPLDFENLRLIKTEDESRRLNDDPEPKVIISASGMCDAGRIRHHLKHNLWRGDSSVIFVGFQAEGTLGRLLVDGAKTVKLFGEEIAVKAKIHNLKGFSAHADKDGLLKWIGSFNEKPKQVFVVHGEEKTTEKYAEELSSMGFSAHSPNLQEVYDLANDVMLAPGITREKIEFAKGSPEFIKLQNAANDLNAIIEKNRHCANKELAKFTAQILELAKKWDI